MRFEEEFSSGFLILLAVEEFASGELDDRIAMTQSIVSGVS